MIAFESQRACSETVPPWIENPYRLVSLGEIVRVFSAHQYIGMADALGFLSGAAFVTEITKPESPSGELYGDTEFSDDRREVLRPMFEELAKDLPLLGLPITAKTAQRGVEALAEPRFTLRQMIDLSSELQGRLVDEMESVVFLAIGADVVRFFTDANLFGDAVPNSFPSTSDDIEEAGKCLALERSTACVFHLTRVLQAGLYALAVDLEIDPSGKNWGLVLGDLEDAIQARKAAGPGSSVTPEEREWWKAGNQFYASAAIHFDYFIDVFRNDVIHKTGKMYSPEKARALFDHAREFMQHLTTRLVEQSK